MSASSASVLAFSSSISRFNSARIHSRCLPTVPISSWRPHWNGWSSFSAANCVACSDSWRIGFRKRELRMLMISTMDSNSCAATISSRSFSWFFWAMPRCSVSNSILTWPISSPR
ncbi:hypothetical protein D3C85_1277020 [compost metagenome]